jgi:hypothetical protein
MQALALLILALSAADHWTTYLCLRAPNAGWEVTEANPIADWLFGSLGLVPGLMLDSAVTLGAVVFLVTTHRLGIATKYGFFALIAFVTGVAVVNNLVAISAIGIPLLGGA